VEEEASARYHRRPAFLRAIADYIAGMTDKFALTEYESLNAAFPSSPPL
jgi:dGTP triphosphohydrolase